MDGMEDVTVVGVREQDVLVGRGYQLMVTEAGPNNRHQRWSACVLEVCRRIPGQGQGGNILGRGLKSDSRIGLSGGWTVGHF